MAAAIALEGDLVTSSVRHYDWPSTEQAAANERQLKERLTAEIASYEAEFDLPSSELAAALRDGRLAESHKVTRWLFALDTLRALGK